MAIAHSMWRILDYYARLNAYRHKHDITRWNDDSWHLRWGGERRWNQDPTHLAPKSLGWAWVEWPLEWWMRPMECESQDERPDSIRTEARLGAERWPTILFRCRTTYSACQILSEGIWHMIAHRTMGFPLSLISVWGRRLKSTGSRWSMSTLDLALRGKRWHFLDVHRRLGPSFTPSFSQLSCIGDTQMLHQNMEQNLWSSWSVLTHSNQHQSTLVNCKGWVWWVAALRLCPLEDVVHLPEEEVSSGAAAGDAAAFLWAASVSGLSKNGDVPPWDR